MVKTFKIFSLSNFQVYIYNTVYSVLCYSRVTMSNNAVHLIPRTYLFKTEFVPFDQPQHTKVLATIFLISVSLSSVFSDSTYKWNNTIFVFSVWIISLSIMLSSSIQDVASSKISFIFFFLKLINIALHICIHMSIFFIHSCVDGHLAGFRVLAIVKRFAMNMGVQVSSR